MIKIIQSIPKLLSLVLSAFLAIIAVRYTYPILDAIFDMWDDSILKTVATLIMWLMYFTVLYVFVWFGLFTKTPTQGDTK